MPDPNITLTAIQSHANALDGAIKRHALQAGRCKTWCAAIVGAVLLFSTGKKQMTALPWAAGVVVLLALADACHTVMSRTCTDAYHAFMRKLPLNGGNAMKPEECFILPPPEIEWRQIGRVLGALGSPSVLSFYGALLALVVAFHIHATGAPAGFGASENRRLGDKDAANPPQAGTAGTSHPMKAATPPARMTLQPGNTGSQSAPIKTQPGQPPSLSPLKPPQQPPGIRLPTVPPNRVPANTVPPNGVPSGAAPPSAPAPVPATSPSAPAPGAPPTAPPPATAPTTSTPPATTGIPAPTAPVPSSPAGQTPPKTSPVAPQPTGSPR